MIYYCTEPPQQDVCLFNKKQIVVNIYTPVLK